MADHIDPVCGMHVEEKDAAGLAEYKGTTYYFESEDCISRFNLHPEQYANKSDKEELSDAPQVKNRVKKNVDRSGASSIPGMAASSPVSAARNS